jgi:hypothetical protein
MTCEACVERQHLSTQCSTHVYTNRKNVIFGDTLHWKGRIDTNRYNVDGHIKFCGLQITKKEGMLET